MYAEIKRLTCQQVAEELSEQDNLTLYGDGTSKLASTMDLFKFLLKEVLIH